MVSINKLYPLAAAGMLIVACQAQNRTSPTNTESQAEQTTAAPVVERKVSKANPIKDRKVKVCTIEQYGDPGFELTDHVDLWDRLRAGFAIPDQNHKRINRYIDWYKKHPGYLDRVAKRGQPYLHHIIEQLEAAELPLELALLPIVESAFDPFAYSHGRASGMWQFVPGTAKAYGLKQNWWYDGRRDVVASTNAAVEYLSYLRDYFEGDWLAALAAYNSGQGTVGRAIRKNRKAGKADDYWSLKLPDETAAYVPQLLALAKLVANPEHYGVELSAIDNKPWFQAVPIGSQIDLSQAAELADISIDELYKLNPGFNRWATDPTGPHELLIPVDKSVTFTTNLSQLSKEKRVGWQRYIIKNGDALSTIAAKFNTDVSTIKTVNGLSGNNIRAGKALMIPAAMADDSKYSYSADQRLAKVQARKPNINNRYKIQYQTQAGDSLWVIAKKHGVSVRNLAKWNSMAPNDPLKVNKTLVIWADNGKDSADNSVATNNQTLRKIYYKVRSGDSLDRIARKFNISVKQIRNWNTKARKKYLQPGDSLTLFVDVRNISH
ncbi:LysM peptidoglycan-binding domain-containing protein [Halioxenophilus aromaticivorans]|uniref:LysM peptidoglycan-binding domain-containing protein n=1 Tax=Halioxenophilus aromaticivorans TaxID=1306992 RepID=A0AAV3TWN9_9ALTE